ncbi:MULTISPECIES: DUF4278 domain-containing protein [Nostoc]|uniref:DUF4278 domain-containing protein n=2 Tax=Nostoc TaxID=1177 RepID=A0ABR8I4L9_9NOSO|nr:MULTISPECIES: DUF4278 domain-containing protein [Nostoc]MBD2560205.1 DUF4278 domain-containing protein [Nostoc linckia FACHB-391]MBD2645861.1 DUF4278 domain-containing protein [Nostoc foliaceum FACHB-393]
MKLYYRGLSYEYDLNKVGSRKVEQPFVPDHNLMYRGITYRVDPKSKVAEATLPQVAYKLSFRGITYFVNKTAQREVTAVSEPASTSKVAVLPFSEELKLQQ